MGTRTGKGSNYLGAHLEAERRLVLVALDPREPWAAFRRMRSWMRHRRPAARPSLGVFTGPIEVGSDRPATVVPLRRRTARRPGGGSG